MSNTATVSALEAPSADDLVYNILQLAEKERQNGNKSITQTKLDNLTNFVLKNQAKRKSSKLNPDKRLVELKSSKSSSQKDSLVGSIYKDITPASSSKKRSIQKPLPPVPYSSLPSLYRKFDIRQHRLSDKPRSSGDKKKLKPKIFGKIGENKISFQRIEKVFIEFLEAVANIIDNLHLFSKLPMFPKVLNRLLRNTNKLWILILVFLIRKTISQLLNVIRKENKVKAELDLVRASGSKLLNDYDKEQETPSGQPQNIFRKYEKILKDLRFDKMMLKLELIGNFLDLSFNLIEFYRLVFPDWIMGTLNAASMMMTIYRMNKDDEYIDDDITEDLI